MDEFIRALLEQVRCKKARAGIAREITDHIKDATAALEQEGMTHEQALAAALPLQVYNTPAYTGIYSIVRMAKPRRRPFIQRDMPLSTPDCAPQYTNRNAAVIIQ